MVDLFVRDWFRVVMVIVAIDVVVVCFKVAEWAIYG